MEQERVEVEKRQKRQEFLKVINSGDCPEDRVLTDEEGRRWVQCEFCGKFAPASAFASYGGFGKLNKGKCYECSRNPNINTEVNTEASVPSNGEQISIDCISVLLKNKSKLF